MQGSTGQQGNQNNQKPGGSLSWSQTPSSASSNNNNAKQNTAAPAKVATPAPKPAPAPKKDEKQGGAGRTASIFIAGIAVGLIIGWGWFSLGKDSDTKVVSEEGTTVTETQKEPTKEKPATTKETTTKETVKETATKPAQNTAASAGTLVVASPQAAGTQVAISNVSVTVPTWVVVFEIVNGKPGNALGAKMFFEKETTGTVELLRGTTAGKTYLVAEYVDNGDHKFDKRADTQVTGITGGPLTAEFTVR